MTPSEPEPEQRTLVAIGVARYSNAAMNLPDVPQMVDCVVDLLANPAMGYQRELTEIAIDPKGSDIAQFAKWCRNRPPGGVLVVYFAAHGDFVDRWGETRHALLLSDWNASTPDETSITLGALARSLASVDHKACLLMADCCFAAAPAPQFLAAFFENAAKSAVSPVRTAVLASARPKEEAFQKNFTDALRAALSSATLTRKCGGPSARYLSLDGLVSLINAELAANPKPQHALLFALSDDVLPFFPNPKYRPELSSVLQAEGSDYFVGRVHELAQLTAYVGGHTGDTQGTSPR